MPNPQATLIGNLAQDPELRFTRDGKAITTLVVATSDSSKDQATGEWESKNPTYTRVTVWDRVAENAAESLRKGDAVIAVGKIGTTSWQGKDGTTQYRTEMLTCWALGFDLRRSAVAPTRTEHAQQAPAADPWATPQNGPQGAPGPQTGPTPPNHEADRWPTPPEGPPPF